MPSSRAAKESRVDVLVIGAGPAGLMASNALARAGVNVRVIDQRSAKVAAGQADGIQPRTIEVLQSYGLAERLLREGNQMHMAAFYNPSPNGGIELTDRVPDVTAVSARYPFEVTLHQGAIENIFLDSMASHGVEVDRPTIPVAIDISGNNAVLQDPTAYPVRVTLHHFHSTASQPDVEIVNAKFVIGADGAHSWVRKSLNIPLEGEQTDYIWGVVDMTPVTDFPDIRNKTVIHSDEGSCMIIPREGDKVRLYIQLENRVNAVKGRLDKSEMGPHQLLDVARKIFKPYTFGTPESFDWWTLYIIGQRVASKFSVKERIFIAGDACHTHSPKAGQGMNASMNDTHNLAWKLIHVLRGWADISTLKTYELERRKYAEDLISFDKRFAKLFSGKPRTEANQDGVSHEEFLQAFQTFGGFTSGIGIRYSPSVLTSSVHQECASNLILGQRILPQTFLRAADARPVEIQDLLPSDTRFKILAFIGNTSDPERRAIINQISERLEGVLGTFAKAIDEDILSLFEVISISCAKRTNVRYNDLPEFLRSHWSKVLIDDADVKDVQRGGGYANYGITPSGAAVVVRPDGYVGMVTPLSAIEDIGSYFAGFMRCKRIE